MLELLRSSQLCITLFAPVGAWLSPTSSRPSAPTCLAHCAFSIAAAFSISIKRELYTFPPAIVLKAALLLGSPTLARLHLDAGIQQWQAGDAALSERFRFFSVFGAAMNLLSKPGLFMPKGLEVTAGDTTLAGRHAVARILFTHPSFSLCEALAMAAVLPSLHWFREMATPDNLSRLALVPADLDAAFWSACVVSDEAIADWCLRAGADVNSKGPLYLIPPETDMPKVAVYWAALCGHTGIVRLLATIPDVDPRALLVAACILGLTDVALPAIRDRELSANIVSTGVLGATTPLAAACEYGRLDTVIALCEHGADVNFDGQRALSSTLIGSSAPERKLEILRELIRRGVSFRLQCFGGLESLETAAGNYGHPLLVEALLDAGATVSNWVQYLRYACKDGIVGLVKMLLQRRLCDPDREVKDTASYLTPRIYRYILNGTTPSSPRATRAVLGQ